MDFFRTVPNPLDLSLHYSDVKSFKVFHGIGRLTYFFCVTLNLDILTCMYNHESVSRINTDVERDNATAYGT
jgi:hypothetical protein